MNLKGQWVWVTGASSGLGQELARQLAGAGANLVLTARRLERLEALRTELVTKGVEVRALAGDTGKHADIDRLLAEVKQLPLAAVVLNAGVTHFGHHHELAWAEFEAMLQLNVVGTARITTELVQHFRVSQASARIMLVTSMAGLYPVPYQSAYSGTKAFLTAFGMSLAHELEGTSVSVTVFAPGGIVTEMTAGEKFGPLRSWLAPVDDVAREAVQALAARPPLHVQGFMNRLGNLAFRFLPRRFVMGQVARQYKKALEATTAK